MIICIISICYATYSRKSSHISGYRSLSSAMEEVEADGDADCDAVVLPPTSSKLDVSDEEDEDYVLDQDCQPIEAARKIEVHNN